MEDLMLAILLGPYIGHPAIFSKKDNPDRADGRFTRYVGGPLNPSNGSIDITDEQGGTRIFRGIDGHNVRTVSLDEENLELHFANGDIFSVEVKNRYATRQ